MDDYRKPPRINRYWTRPKGRVYECNLRDAERFYRDSYKLYQDEKEYIQRKDRGWSIDKTDRFAHLRAGPIRRETSLQPSSHHAVAASLVEGVLSRTSASNDASAAESTTFEASPVPVYDPQRENASLEERLARLKRLREDLGLPSESQSSQKTLQESATRITNSTISNDVDSSYKSDRSARLSSRTGAGAVSDESSYSFKSERSSKVNGIGDDYKSKSDRSTEEFKLTPRLERKRQEYNITPKSERKSYSTKEDKKADDYSFSSKSEIKADRFSKLSTTASSSSPGRTRKVITTETLDFGDDDDDASVVKMMKKLPSSQEILDRISKMELDD